MSERKDLQSGLGMTSVILLNSRLIKRLWTGGWVIVVRLYNPPVGTLFYAASKGIQCAQLVKLAIFQNKSSCYPALPSKL